jgi:hypothetical protein
VSGKEKQQFQVIQILLTAARIVALKNVPTIGKIDFNVLARQVQTFLLTIPVSYSTATG